MDFKKIDKKAIIKLLTNEFNSPTVSMVETYKKEGLLPEFNNEGELKVEEIKRTRKNIEVFIPIADKYLFFCFSCTLNSKGNLIVEFVEIRASLNIFLSFSSEKLALSELVNKLKNIKSKNLLIVKKGDIINKKNQLKSSCNQVTIRTNESPDKFNKKFKSFIEILQANKNEILELVKLTGDNVVWIGVCFYSKYPCTDVYVDTRSIEILSKLGLQLVYDINAL